WGRRRPGLQARRRRPHPIGRWKNLLARENGGLQCLLDPRLDDSLGGDLDRVARGGVTAHARLALLDHEFHHAGQDELPGSLQFLFGKRRQLVEVLARRRALHFEALCKVREELGLAHSPGLYHVRPPGSEYRRALTYGPQTWTARAGPVANYGRN